ncbi:hypothetical protein GQ55_5G412900 [Panicum hallii var. hallii]|uniref:F-box domain-containing protein n=1 Tax=Panicum hallii var. hallii TaxID=1504633 RepID=A0A2T7DNM8_9POAL|nr:hypothetical protein GQ55_5G408300 [Panicum hallii var. hallii]PUZ57230.1 hypothetical protein GQ55_5G412900 [Panicum hallii var. hallii]
MAHAPRLASNHRSHGGMALPALMEELVEEILLCIPPDEPAHLIRAALVCKDWCRIISDGGFRRRYRRFHRTPPLLGYIIEEYITAPKFVPTTTFSPPPLPATRSFRAVDCRHGRVLMTDIHGDPPGFIVWDLITGNGPRLSINIPAYFPHEYLCTSTGAVLCARHGCDHLDCHDGPFLVVFVGSYDDDDAANNDMYTSASVYSSETGAWSAQTPSVDYELLGLGEPCLLIGDALYVTLFSSRIEILKYDLGGHGLSVIDTPVMRGVAVPMDIDGGLGLVEYDHGCIYTWSRQADGGWVRHNVAELQTIYFPRCNRYNKFGMIRFAQETNTVLFSLDDYIDQGVFALDLKSRQVTKVGETRAYNILPCMSFYTPDLAKGKLSPQ